MIANATGCSSIYGGNLPTTPWTTDADGRGPAWSNSLFEDNAEFGLGLRLAADQHAELARELLAELREAIGADLVDDILERAAGQRVRARARSASGSPSSSGGSTGRRPGRRRRPAQRCRRPGPAQRVDRRRRRLGLRHRLRRPRPRAGQRAQRERAGARHRGLLQHRRPDVEGDAARARSPSSPRPARPCRRRTSRCWPSPTATSTSPGWRWAPTRSRPARLPRGRGLRRSVADHRLQPLHRARHRHARRARPAVPRRRQRLLAAGPLRPDGPRAAGGNPFLLDSPRPRIALADYTQRELRYRNARQHAPGRGRTAGQPGPGSGRPALGHLRGHGTRGAHQFPADARKDR